jgi:WD40 repeat protein
MPRSSVRISFRILLVASIGLLSLATVSGNETQFLPNLLISSTIPANADLNPYGVAFVPEGFPENGLLLPGDILVSNFNNATNAQGTGTTIIKFTPKVNGAVSPAVPPATVPPTPGNATTFFTSGPIGLTTALGVLKGGFVLVGNLPTSNGTITSGASLQVIDRNGDLVGSPIVDSTFLDSPWDLTVNDDGASAQVFVSNVVSGTVSRLDLAVDSSGVAILRKTQIATGYTSQLNSAALILGPTGLAYDANADVLYVASTADNMIFAIPNAGHRRTAVVKGTVVFSDPHLRGPLALAFAPNGDLLTANGDAVNADPTHPSEIVEFTKSGQFIAEFNVDAGQGGAFGLATSRFFFNFAAVDDNTNSIYVLSLSAGINPAAQTSGETK